MVDVMEKSDRQRDKRHREHLAEVKRLAEIAEATASKAADSARVSEENRRLTQRIEYMKWVGGLLVSAVIYLLSSRYLFG
jgi:hypothetical protein